MNKTNNLLVGLFSDLVEHGQGIIFIVPLYTFTMHDVGFFADIQYADVTNLF